MDDFIDATYIRETSWQEGIKTGSIVVFEDVLVPFAAKNLNNKEIQTRIFGLIEQLMNECEYRQMVAGFFLETLVYDHDIGAFEQYLGPKSRESVDEILRQMVS